MAERKLIVTILGDSRQLERSFTRSSAAANKFGHDVDTVAGRVDSRFTKLRNVAAGGFVGGVAVTAGISALKSVAQAAAESQQVLGQTRVALEQTGNSWGQYGAQIEKTVQAQSRLGFDDEALLRTFSMFIRRTGDVSTALRDNALAADVARARFIDLESAAGIVNKAALGQEGSLRRLGIRVGEATTGFELLALLQEKYGGSAEAAAGDAATSFERVTVSTENLKESIGTLSNPYLTELATVLANASDMAAGLVAGLQTIGQVKIPTIEIPFLVTVGGGTVGGLAGEIVKNAIKFGGPQGIFVGGFELGQVIADQFKAAPKTDSRAAAEAFVADTGIGGFFDELPKATQKAVRDGAKSFGEKGFKPLPENLLGERAAQQFEATLASLSLQFDQAVVTRGTADELGILSDMRRVINARIATHGRSTELLRLLFETDEKRRDVIEGAASTAATARQDALDKIRDLARERREQQEKIRAALAEAAQARQFRAIGLGPEGDELVPTVANLSRQLDALRDNIVGEDVPKKLTNRLAGVAKTLKGGFGKVTEETRTAIQQLFEAIRQEFDKGTSTTGPLTKTTALNVTKLFAGAVLDRNTEKILRANLSGFNSAALALAGGARPSGTFRGGQPVVIENHTTVNLDGETVGRSVTRTQQKDLRRNPRQKRGPNRRGGI